MIQRFKTSGILFAVFFALVSSCALENGHETGNAETEGSQPAQRSFLGSFGQYSEAIMSIRSTGMPPTIPPGPGEIVGQIVARGAPIEGVKLRLYLNDDSSSALVSSNSEGIYAVRVPYGTYKISGWDLDIQAANNLLAGLISSPDNNIRLLETTASPANPGIGPNLSFDEPVVVLAPTGRVDVSDPVVVEWAQHPRATRYRVNLYEIADPDSIRFTTIYSGSSAPVIKGDSFDFTEYEGVLKDGYYYMVVVDALDSNGTALASSRWNIEQKDFRYLAQ